MASTQIRCWWWWRKITNNLQKQDGSKGHRPNSAKVKWIWQMGKERGGKTVPKSNYHSPPSRAIPSFLRHAIKCYWSSLNSSRFQAGENQVSRKQTRSQSHGTYFYLLFLLGLWISWAGLNSVSFLLVIILVFYIYSSKLEPAALLLVS